MEEERDVQGDVILLRFEDGSKVNLVETDVWEQSALVQLVLYPSCKEEDSFGLQSYQPGSFHHKWLF